jgi:membrane associated rhomboid family serine protease
MSNDPASSRSQTRRRPNGSGWVWTLDSGSPDEVLARARTAFFVMVGILVLLWAIQIINVVTGYHLTYNYGIQPRHVSTLPYILTSPFLHVSWTHIEGNSGPLFIFGFLAAYRGIGKFAAVTLITALTSGFAAWFFAPSNSVVVGASGVIFGYLGYILVRGLFDRHGLDVLIGAVMALCFAYQFTVLLPHQGIAWQAHIGGVVGGIACGWLLRDRRGARAAAPARQTSVATAPGTAVQPASAAAVTSSHAAKSKGKGKADGKDGFAVDPSNPRADLYKQLDDMGL